MDLAVVLEALGTAGLVATVVEFTYVVTNTENFTTFEKVFFLTSGCLEMAGEVMFFLWGLQFLARQQTSADRWSAVKAIVKDPVRNLAVISKKEMEERGYEDKKDDLISRWSVFAIIVSILSLFVWATFWPVWGNDFEGDGDDGLRLALSICSLCTAVVLFGSLYYVIDDLTGMLCFFMYAMEKVFEVYILLSDLERLCPGDLGKALVGFHVMEILSVTYILGYMIFLALERSKNPTETVRPPAEV